MTLLLIVVSGNGVEDAASTVRNNRIDRGRGELVVHCVGNGRTEHRVRNNAGGDTTLAIGQAT